MTKSLKNIGFSRDACGLTDYNIHPNGKMRKRANTGNENEAFMFRYRYKDGYWYLSEYRSNEELRKQGIIQ